MYLAPHEQILVLTVKMVPQPVELLEPHFILINAPPDPFEIRGLCACAIDNTCQHRRRARAPRRSHRSAASRNDGGRGGGSDPDPDSAPNLEPRAASI